jgi:hypothetical protein
MTGQIVDGTIDPAFDASMSSFQPLLSEHQQGIWTACIERNTNYNSKSVMHKVSSWMESG